MKAWITAIATLLAALAFAPGTAAQSLGLTVDPSAFAFPPADPDVVAVIDSPTLTIGYSVNGGGNSPPWHITMRANSDLLSGSDSIPVSNISWTGGGVPLAFASGAALSTGDQALLSTSGKVSGAGTVTFHLQNLWTYKAGTYITTIVFTISAP